MPVRGRRLSPGPGPGGRAGGGAARHWKPAPCITAPDIMYPHLINLIKLRTSNHKLAIQQLRQVYPIVYHGHFQDMPSLQTLVMSRMSAT
jgi:hypothetical protein